jgi:hypothetical protein
MTIGQDGNVGIGTESPEEKLHLAGPGGAAHRIIVESTLNNVQAQLLVGDSIAHTGSKSNHDFRIRTNDTDRMTIDTAGNVGIGTTSPVAPLELVGATSSTLGSPNIRLSGRTYEEYTTIGFGYNGSPAGYQPVEIGYYESTQTADTKGDLIFATRSATLKSTAPSVRMTIDSDGDITGTHGNYHVSSDERLKKDIVTIPNALDKVLALRGVNFKWKEKEDQSLMMGMIAQEVESVIPEVVHTQDNEMETKAVEYQFVVGVLVEAIKELSAKVEALENE